MTESITYNPEGSLLRRDQMEQLNTLKFLAEICRQNDIRWWLSSGTLLGAARHKGFIPWDDDIDIVMLKEDYKRLERILGDLESDEYFFQSIKTDVEYINIFGKLRRKSGCRDAKDRRNAYYKYKGVGLDIFAIEKTNRLSAVIAKFLYHNIQYPTSYIKIAWVRRPLVRLIEALHLGLIFPLLRIIGKINFTGEYHYVLGTGWPKHTFHMKYTFPLTTAEFEGEQMPVPNDMDAYLTTVFGDWRTLPSEDVIRKSIHCREYLEEIFGTEAKILEKR